MSKRPEPGWSLWCDWPDCDYQFEAGDYTIFGDGWDATEIMEDSGGHASVDGQQHYCGDHPIAWASDLADGDTPPAPPYLLIHDGDTGKPDDDGLVTLIEAVTR